MSDKTDKTSKPGHQCKILKKQEKREGFANF